MGVGGKRLALAALSSVPTLHGPQGRFGRVRKVSLPPRSIPGPSIYIYIFCVAQDFDIQGVRNLRFVGCTEFLKYKREIWQFNPLKTKRVCFI
jgi:hypothetical protein